MSFTSNACLGNLPLFPCILGVTSFCKYCWTNTARRSLNTACIYFIKVSLHILCPYSSNLDNDIYTQSIIHFFFYLTVSSPQCKWLCIWAETTVLSRKNEEQLSPLKYLQLQEKTIFSFTSGLPALEANSSCWCSLFRFARLIAWGSITKTGLSSSSC